jgi:hypothetical protein
LKIEKFTTKELTYIAMFAALCGLALYFHEFMAGVGPIRLTLTGFLLSMFSVLCACFVRKVGTSTLLGVGGGLLFFILSGNFIHWITISIGGVLTDMIFSTRRYNLTLSLATIGGTVFGISRTWGSGFYWLSYYLANFTLPMILFIWGAFLIASIIGSVLGYKIFGEIRGVITAE